MAKIKSDFILAVTQLAAERNLPREVVLRAVEIALASAFKKEGFGDNQDISVKLMPETGEVKVYVQKVVVEEPKDYSREIPLSEARKLEKDIQVGGLIEVESTPENLGRVTAQVAKQVILQRLREAERDAIFGEYAGKEEEVVSGIVRFVEPKQVIVDLGGTEAILPSQEQVAAERYRVGQRLKLYLTQVLRTNKGTQLVVSRTHPNLVRRLFELEVPEIYNGIVELKGIAREPGYRSKVAIAACQEGVDPIGCCVGLRGIRIQNITKELNGEKIDIISWHADPAIFIANALAPASVAKVEVKEMEKSATVIVPDKQLSLAIGKGGQNARLAAKLTGFRIDIKSTSMVEAETKAPVEPEAKEVISELPAPPSEVIEEAITPIEETPRKEVEVTPLPSFSIEQFLAEEKTVTTGSQIRFAEDLLPFKGSKEKKKEKSEDKAKPKKAPKRESLLPEEGDEE